MKAYPGNMFRSIGLGLLFLLGLLVFVMSLRFFSFETQGILLDKPDVVVQHPVYRLLFYGHISLGMIALIIGPWQFVPRLRNTYLSIHRRIGQVYVLCCLISGICGLGIAPFALGGWVSGTGFAFLAIFWMISTWLAYRAIRQKKVAAHQQWMIRSYAFTFAAVTLRLGLLLAAFGLVPFLVIYKIVAWASWLINIVIAEWIIRKIRTT